jgi:hypothetical protein
MVVELVDFRGDPGVERFGGRSRGSLAEITPSLQDGEAFWGGFPRVSPGAIITGSLWAPAAVGLPAGGSENSLGQGPGNAIPKLGLPQRGGLNRADVKVSVPVVALWHEATRKERMEWRCWDVGGWIRPSLQDGEAFWGWLPPGFTRGYYHWLPLGAGCGDVVQ